MRTTKLDMYDYNIEFMDEIVYIYILVDRGEQYLIADISSNLTASNHQVYLDGCYYLVTDVNIIHTNLKLTIENKVALCLTAKVLDRADVI